MAAKLLTSSGAFATSGTNARVLGLILTGTHATTIGTAVVKAGGSSGTNVTITHYVGPGETVQIDLRGYGVIGDYLTLSNAQGHVHFQPDRA